MDSTLDDSIDRKPVIRHPSYTRKYFEEGEDKLRCLLCVDKECTFSKLGGTANLARHLQRYHAGEVALELATVRERLRNRRRQGPPRVRQRYKVEHKDEHDDNKSLIIEFEGSETEHAYATVDHTDEITIEEDEAQTFEMEYDNATYSEQPAITEVNYGDMDKIQLQKAQLEVYKLKLEALKLERELDLPRSEFTRDV